MFTASLAQAQSQNLYDWAWIARLGATTLPGPGAPTFPPSLNQPESLAADATGNVIIAGVYNPDVIFDNPAVRYQITTGPLGPTDNSYVAKYGPSGALTWSMNLTSNGDTRVRNLAVDAAGNIYVLGFYYQQLSINAALAAVANTNTPCFLAKITPAGVLSWAITLEPDVPTSRFSLSHLAVDAVGNSVVQGEFDSQTTINGTTFAGAAGKAHCLVLRYSTAGVMLGGFAGYTVAGTESNRGFTGVALTATGEVYLSGYVAPAASLQFGNLPAVNGPPTGNAMGFVVKLNASNTAAWTLKTTGPGSQSIDHIATGPQNHCYLLGSLVGSTMTLGTQSLNTNNAAGSSGKDVFLARISPSGAVESLVGGGGTSRALGLALSAQGEVSIATAGGLSWGNVQLPGAAWPTSTKAGLLQLDAAGVPQRGWQAGAGFLTTAVAVDGLNRPILAGTYNAASPFAFGTRQSTSPYAFNTLIARTALTPLATRQAAQVAGLEVYPNPARYAVEIHTAQAGLTQIQLLDALGHRVRTQNLSAGQTRVELAGMAAGSYTLLVQQGDARSYRHLTVAP